MFSNFTIHILNSKFQEMSNECILTWRQKHMCSIGQRKLGLMACKGMVNEIKRERFYPISLYNK